MNIGGDAGPLGGGAVSLADMSDEELAALESLASVRAAVVAPEPDPVSEAAEDEAEAT